MFPKTWLTAAFIVCLLFIGGFALAQSPSVNVAVSPNPVEQGTAAEVIMTFSGLPLNANLQFYGYVVSENYEACEGAGLGVTHTMSTGNSQSLTRTGIIASSCPIGQYTLDVTLLTAGNATLAQSSVSFAVVEAVDPIAALGGAFQRLGAIGLIFRKYAPELNVEIWGITPESEGFFLLRVTQAQIDATQPDGLVASTADGRVAVHVGAEPERNVTISLGPNPKGKVHHVTLANNLDGAVIATTTTENGPPGALAPITSQPVPAPTPLTYYAPSVDPQPARADGSIVHVVRAGNTTNTIAQAYRVDPQIIIERNQLAGGGRLIFPGQELVIRDATSSNGNNASLPKLPTPVYAEENIAVLPTLPAPIYAGDDE